MPEPFPFELVAPERLLFSGPVEAVIVPSVEGDMTVLAHHAPVMAVLKPGLITVEEGGRAQQIFVRGGFADIRPDGLTILAEHAVPREELSPAMLDIAIQDAQEDVDDATTDQQRTVALQRLGQLREVRGVLNV
ncbi:F0F1 ATP synthase subunit epsilon [Chelatococcus reniformis]|uniref:ATP synthase epsilon chain n=1 Tax=Chelatococcus reniformis TaxID=1494448 RepID=A0A916TXU2_9HYPH|nr:F0F1 ATP synthase subunit epsilon [Chelatococcus reniformis]GGC51066.1 ATP synthase epsilon chain [Chelatococcus reniformis]